MNVALSDPISRSAFQQTIPARRMITRLCAGYEVDADGVLDFPHRISRLRTVTKKEERELVLRWYSSRDGRVVLRIQRVIIQRKSPRSEDVKQLDVLEQAISAAQSGAVSTNGG